MRRALVLLVLFLCACQHAEDRFAKRPISKSEVIGRWGATDDSIKTMRDIGIRDHLRREDHLMELRPDGSCLFHSVLLGTRPTYRTIDRACAWKLTRFEHQALELRFGEGAVFEAAYFFFAEEDGQLLIWQHADDPDTWRYFEYMKK